jgi:hypothetical protein
MRRPALPIRRYFRSAAALVVVLIGTGCQMANSPLAPPPTAVLDGAVSVAGPRGYCVDPAATHELADAAVALIGRCPGALAVTPALLTMTVGPAASAGVLAAGGPAMTEYFTSAEGRAALSRSGQALDVRVIAAVGVGDAYLLHLQDRAVGEYWRAVVGLNGRLVTVSANGTQGAPLPPPVGRALLDATLIALRRVN